MEIKAVIAGVALIWASAVHAEIEMGTVRTSGYPLTKNGNLIGCELEFQNLHLDNIYQHNPVSVSGSIALVKTDTTPVFNYKLVVGDFIETDATTSIRPSVPTTINIVAPDGRSSKGLEVVSAVSDTPGGRINVYPFSREFIDVLVSILEKQNATILFNRRPDGLDVRVPVDFTVASTDATGEKTKNNTAVMNFISCQRTITKELLNSPQK